MEHLRRAWGKPQKTTLNPNLGMVAKSLVGSPTNEHDRNLNKSMHSEESSSRAVEG